MSRGCQSDTKDKAHQLSCFETMVSNSDRPELSQFEAWAPVGGVVSRGERALVINFADFFPRARKGCMWLCSCVRFPFQSLQQLSMKNCVRCCAGAPELPDPAIRTSHHHLLCHNRHFLSWRPEQSNPHQVLQFSRLIISSIWSLPHLHPTTLCFYFASSSSSPHDREFVKKLDRLSLA